MEDHTQAVGRSHEGADGSREEADSAGSLGVGSHEEAEDVRSHEVVDSHEDGRTQDDGRSQHVGEGSGHEAAIREERLGHCLEAGDAPVLASGAAQAAHLSRLEPQARAGKRLRGRGRAARGHLDAAIWHMRRQRGHRDLAVRAAGIQPGAAAHGYRRSFLLRAGDALVGESRGGCLLLLSLRVRGRCAGSRLGAPRARCSPAERSRAVVQARGANKGRRGRPARLR